MSRALVLFFVLAMSMAVSAGALASSSSDRCEKELLAISKPVRVREAFYRIINKAGDELISDAELLQMLRNGDFFTLTSGGPSHKGHIRRLLTELRKSYRRLSLHEQEQVALQFSQIIQDALFRRQATAAKQREVSKRHAVLYNPHFVAERKFNDIAFVSTWSNSDFIAIIENSGAASVRLMNVTTGAILPAFQYLGLGTRILDVVQAGDSLVGVSYPGYSLSVWNLNSGAITGSLSQREAPIRAVTSSRDGRVIVAALENRKFCVWDGLQASPRIIGGKPQEGDVVGIAVTENGKSLIAAFSTGRTLQWNLETERLEKTLHDGIGYETAITLSRHGDLLAQTKRGTHSVVTLRHLKNQEGARFHLRPEDVDLHAPSTLSPTARFIAAKYDRAVWVRDVLAGVTLELRASRGLINGLVFSENEKYLVVSTSGGTIERWDLEQIFGLQEDTR